MGWREALLEWAGDIEWPDSIQAVALRDGVERTLLDLPPADRIALARELLAGTGRVVARNMPLLSSDLFDGASNDARPFRNGWNACRAAMMVDEP